MSNELRQKLIIITGSPCVGKTTVADALFTSYDNIAFLTAIGRGALIHFQLTIQD